MEISITFNVSPHKYYQEYISDHYNDFTDNEKDDLIKHINSEKFKVIMITHISNNGEYSGEAKINKVTPFENKDGLYFTIQATFTNPDNYSAKKMIKIIRDTDDHYYSAGGFYYSDPYYYKCNHCTKEINFDDCEHEHDFEKCGIEICKKEDSEHRGKYEFNISIYDIHVNNEEYWNMHGTNKSNFKRNCEHHNYYIYFYNNDDVVDSDCLDDMKWEESSEEEILLNIKSKMHYFLPKYTRLYITNKKHELIFEKIRSI